MHYCTNVFFESCMLAWNNTRWKLRHISKYMSTSLSQIWMYQSATFINEWNWLLFFISSLPVNSWYLKLLYLKVNFLAPGNLFWYIRSLKWTLTFVFEITEADCISYHDPTPAEKPGIQNSSPVIPHLAWNIMESCIA